MTSSAKKPQARAAKPAKVMKKTTKPTAEKSETSKPAARQPAAKKTAAQKTPSAGKTVVKKTAAKATERAKLIESKIAFDGPLFRIYRDHIVEPGGKAAWRDVIRHNGSVVILAVDYGKGKGKDRKDPWIVIERQYRHAAGQYLWELPAGKLDAGEYPLHGAQRELAEETGYAAHHWSRLVYYYPSPGFLGEGMYIFLAEGLIPGDAHPEDDEQIDFRLVRLSELLERIEKGSIIDGKTLVGALLFARAVGVKPRKKHH